MRYLRAKLTYSNVVSTICLVLLLGGGTAYAATHLARNSVGSGQIKKGAVTPSKLSGGAKAALAGPMGPTGPQGPRGDKGDRGEKGDQGDRGPSDAITKFDPGVVPWSTTYTTIETLNLGAGSWVVTATGLAVNVESTQEAAECRLLVGGTTVDATGEFFLAPFLEPGAHQTFSLTGAATAPAATAAELQCLSGPDPGGNVGEPDITAIQVGELKTE
jgi:hypothetical protein